MYHLYRLLPSGLVLSSRLPIINLGVETYCVQVPFRQTWMVSLLTHVVLSFYRGPSWGSRYYVSGYSLHVQCSFLLLCPVSHWTRR